MTDEKRAGIHLSDGYFELNIGGKTKKYKALRLWQRLRIGAINAGVEIDINKLQNDDIESLKYANNFLYTYAGNGAEIASVIMYGNNLMMRTLLTRPLGKWFIKYKSKQLLHKLTPIDLLNIMLVVSTNEDTANFIHAMTYTLTFRVINRDEVVAMIK